MKKTFFAALAAMLIFAVAGSGNLFAGGKLAPKPDNDKIVKVHKTEKTTTKTVATTSEKKMVVKHHKAHKAHKAMKKDVK
ncbi:MAG: hypothetical protein M1419_08005 [Bacteroidetes bacterium]|nr:hypothetical protein [Bacteroidota bacterium]